MPLLGVSVHGNHEEFIHEQIFIISNYKLSTAIRIQSQRRGDEGGELAGEWTRKRRGRRGEGGERRKRKGHHFTEYIILSQLMIIINYDINILKRKTGFLLFML